MHTHTDIDIDAPSFREEAHEAEVSALARELAREEGVDLSALLAVLTMADDLDAEVAAEAVIETYRERAREQLEGLR